MVVYTPKLKLLQEMEILEVQVVVQALEIMAQAVVQFNLLNQENLVTMDLDLQEAVQNLNPILQMMEAAVAVAQAQLAATLKISQVVQVTEVQVKHTQSQTEQLQFIMLAVAAVVLTTVVQVLETVAVAAASRPVAAPSATNLRPTTWTKSPSRARRGD